MTNHPHRPRDPNQRAKEVVDIATTEPIKVFTIAHVPPDLAQPWLQHLRDFDRAHPGCHFQVFADTPDMSTEEVVKMMVVKPDLSFTQFFERKKP